MLTLLSALGSLLAFRVRSRLSLELELVALRHQLTVLRRQRPSRPRLFTTDRLLWVWLYRIWPKVLDAIVLVKPATVVDWHRKGFRLYWRRRSRPLGRPGMNREIRDLIPYGQRIGPAVGPIAPPHEDSSAGAHPIALGSEPAPRGRGPCSGETAGRCPSLGGSARHGRLARSIHLPLRQLVRREHASFWVNLGVVAFPGLLQLSLNRRSAAWTLLVIA